MDLVEYAKSLVARRSEGVLAVHRAVSLPEWAPQMKPMPRQRAEVG